MSRLRANWRLALVGSILAVQLLTVAHARTVDTRYLAWAPYDQISFYEIEVDIDGRTLDADEVVVRYRLGLWVEDDIAHGRENRAIAHVHSYVRRAEADTNDIVVTVSSSTNGGPVEVWTWSP
ncbi:MAG: hypothetical protein AAF081_00535 [Actinomycetota bacterium]